MGKKKRNKNSKKDKEALLVKKSSNGVKQSWAKRLKKGLFQPVNVLLLRFLALMLLFYVVWVSPFFQNYFIKNISIAYAKVSSVFLNLFGYSVFTTEDVIRDELFAISIKNGCDGVEGLAIYLCAILIFPTSWRNKLKGMLLGVSFLVLLNIFRIVSLYMIGVHFPSIFDLMHESVWQVLFIMLSLLALLVFIQKSQSTKEVDGNLNL